VIELLTNEEMKTADAATIAGGVPGIDLMEAAGRAVADAARGMCPVPCTVAVVCGPGNNGGDGFVGARLLAEWGYPVRLMLLGSRAALRGDAAVAAKRWAGEAERFDAGTLKGCGLIVDALFGAGLTRDLDGEAKAAVERINASDCPVLAVDVPSGVDGDSGRVRGVAVKATKTVTFFRYKPGHLLLPGRMLCGERVLAQIGIPDAVLPEIGSRSFHNVPALWRAGYPEPSLESHKYTRGHALVAAGSEMAGAARLASRASLRAGAGVVTVAASTEMLPIFKAALEAVIVRAMDDLDDYAHLLEDKRRNALLVGPGAGLGADTRDRVRMALGAGRPVVLDADALTSFETQPRALHQAIAASDRPVVMTPHEGEFRRLFRQIAEGSDSKLEKARAAAALSGAVIVLKGADTVVASPDRRAAIADNGTPWLATAGSGDVLAGIVTGLLAQNMPGFEAACAAVWLHGEAGSSIGPGLISEDLPDALPGVLKRLLS
jgi:ADP-dependent NAD(P)H-hydrate dehydratase / NAD(P)H-hydrate epimerase